MTAITQALLPNGRQQFFDANGKPLAGGSVAIWAVGTTNPLPSYQDPYGAVLNQNPVPLDAAGTALIYGAGQYRQVVFDAAGNTIWDALTYGIIANAAASGGFGLQTALASAATAQLGSVAGHNALITGNVPIGNFGNQGVLTAPIYYIEFDAALTLLADPVSMILPGGKDIPTAHGDAALVEFLGGANWKVIAFWPAAGLSQGFGLSYSLASAATVDLGSVLTNNVNITGIMAVTGLGANASLQRPIYNVTFAGAMTLTQGASLALLGGKDIITAAGDSGTFQYLGAGAWQQLSFNRKAGLGIPPNIQRVFLATANGAFDFTLPSTVTPQTRIRFRLCAPSGSGGGTDASNGGGGGGGGSGGCWHGVLYGFAGSLHITGTVGGLSAAGGIGLAGNDGNALTKFTYNAVDVVLCNVGKGGGKNGGGAAAAGGTTVTNFAGLNVEEILYSGGKAGTPGNYSASSVNFGGAGGALVPFGSAGASIGGLSGAGGVNGNDASGYGAGGGGGTIDNTGRGGNGAPGMFEMEILG